MNWKTEHSREREWEEIPWYEKVFEVDGINFLNSHWIEELSTLCSMWVVEWWRWGKVVRIWMNFRRWKIGQFEWKWKYRAKNKRKNTFTSSSSSQSIEQSAQSDQSDITRTRKQKWTCLLIYTIMLLALFCV